jgi:signal transduction histidine kinase
MSISARMFVGGKVSHKLNQRGFSLVLGGRVFLVLVMLFASSLRGQSFKETLAKAYFCETDSCANSYFKEARAMFSTEGDQAWYDYFKFFYNVKVERYDSADYYYDLSQPGMLRLENWKLYFNSLDAKVNTLRDRSLQDEAVVLLTEGVDLAVTRGLAYYQALIHIKLSYGYHDLSLYKEGIKQGQMAKALLDTTKVYKKDLFSAINAIAINYDDADQPDSALYFHYMVLGIGLENTDDWSASSTLNNMGNTYLKMDELDSAQKYLKQSLSLARTANRSNTLSAVYNNLGEIHLRKREYEEAKKVLDSALFYAENDVLSPLEKRRDVYGNLYKYYQQVGDMAGAFHYQSLFIRYRDSMQDLDQIEAIKALQLKKATAVKDKELAEAEIELQKRNIGILAISSLLALSLTFLRQFYLKRQKVAQEAQLKLQEERLRISRDLHDNIGAELSYISSLIDQKTYGLVDEKLKLEYEQLSNSSRSAMSQLRETIWAIRPGEVRLENFVNRLKELGFKYSQGLNLEVTVGFRGENYLLKPAQIINLFRICQEALNNALKHGGASVIRIELSAMKGKLQIAISDNGKGFSAEEVKRGYGLNNMAERVKELGGEMEFRSENGGGTEIEIWIAMV